MRAFFLVVWLLALAPVLAGDLKGPGDMAAIQAWVNDGSTVAGDTYEMNAGTYSWGGLDTHLNINKAVTIRGQGKGVTIIEDDKTVSSGTDGTYTVLLSCQEGGVVRLSDFTFRDGLRTEDPELPWGHIQVAGVSGVDPNTTTGRFAIERVHFDISLGSGEFICVTGAGMGGVFECSNRPRAQGGRFVWSRWERNSSGTGDGGDYSWEIGPQLSSDKFVFIEDCVWDKSGFSNEGIYDGWAGSRLVVRHSTLINSKVTNHGAETGSRRGGHLLLVYKNEFIVPPGGDGGSILVRYRSGTGLVYDNELTGYTSGSGVAMTPYRLTGPSLGQWGEADGTRSWDFNDDGNNPYDSGTVTSGTGGEGITGTLTDTSKNWDPDQWVGYTCNLIDGVLDWTRSGGGNGDMNLGLIVSNTSDTLTFSNGKDNGNGVFVCKPGAGESYEINLVLEILDQPGRSGGTPYIATDSTAVREGEAPEGWSQFDAPIFAWNNLKDGSPISYSNQGHPTVRQGEHYHVCTDLADAESKGLVYTEYEYPHPLRTTPPSVKKRPVGNPAVRRGNLLLAP